MVQLLEMREPGLWAQVNLARFIKFKHEVLHLGCSNRQSQYKWGVNRARPCKEGLAVLLGGSWVSQHCALSPNSQLCSALHHRQHGLQVGGGFISVILSLCAVRSHLEFCIQVWSPWYR